MVATVGSISVDLAVKSAGFEAGFRKAATTVEKESGRMATAATKAQSVIGQFFAGLGAGAALAGVASLSGALAKARKALSDFDDIGDTSRTLGLTTKGFQVLSFAALEAGISQEKLNAALGIFAKNVGLAATGQGQLFTGLQKLNPELLKNILNAKTQEERLDLVANAMARATSATERAALATTIFGRGGLEMTRILEDGAAGLDDFAKRAEALGIIVPDELIQRAGALGDELDVITKAIDINLSVALAELGPVLVLAADGMLDFARDIKEAAAVITDFVNNPSLAKLQKILADGFELNIAEGSLTDQIRDGIVGTGADELQREIAAVTDEIAKLQAAKDKLSEGDPSLGSLSVAISEAKQRLAELNAEMEELRNAADAAAAGVGGLGDEINRLQDKEITVKVNTVGADTLPTVTSLGGVETPSTAKTSKSSSSSVDPLEVYDTGYATGGYTGNVPTDQVAGFVHGGEFVFDAAATRKIGADNLEAIRKGVRGYQSGGSVGTASGGSDVLSMIEDNTYQGLMEIRRAIGYLDALVLEEKATQDAVRSLQGSISTSSSSSGSSTTSSASSGTASTSGSWYGGIKSIQADDTSGLYQSYATGGIAFEPSIFGEAGPEAAVPLPDGRSIPVTLDGAVGNANIALNYYAAAGNPDPSPQSMMELQDRVRRTVQDVMRGL